MSSPAEALDRRLTTWELETGSFASFCGNGFTDDGTSGSFRAHGGNFHGGTYDSAVSNLSVP